MIKALIDIGTNTTHMLIAELDQEGKSINQVIFKKRYYTYLGEYGLEKIHKIPLTKLYNALDQFEEQIINLKVEQVKVVATEALRTASNGEEIRQTIQQQHGWTPIIIDGLQEARWIADGASQAVDMSDGHFLVMDIGGGSVEFISVQHGANKEMISTPLGISRLFEKYHTVDPIPSASVDRLYNDVEAILKTSPLEGVVKSHTTLVGTAGSFELFLTQEELADITFFTKNLDAQYVIDLTEELIPSSLAQRMVNPKIPQDRAKYIIVAFLLMTAVIKYYDIKKVIISKYALKEGAILS